jgi:hypothetical protein
MVWYAYVNGCAYVCYECHVCMCPCIYIVYGYAQYVCASMCWISVPNVCVNVSLCANETKTNANT